MNTKLKYEDDLLEDAFMDDKVPTIIRPQSSNVRVAKKKKRDMSGIIDNSKRLWDLIVAMSLGLSIVMIIRTPSLPAKIVACVVLVHLSTITLKRWFNR